MLAPPPEAVESRDKGALEDAGRQRYLDSLERRLGRLEGGGNSGGRNQLTSKDILQSLSEAKDDHMQQRGTRVGQNGPQSSSAWSGGGGRESPFSIRNEFADVDLSGGVSVVGEVEGGRDKRVGMEGGGEERPPVSGGSSMWTCCFRCQGGGGRGGYSRAGRGGYEVEEDCSRLVDCDELSLEWQRQDINDIT